MGRLARGELVSAAVSRRLNGWWRPAPTCRWLLPGSAPIPWPIRRAYGTRPAPATASGPDVGYLGATAYAVLAEWDHPAVAAALVVDGIPVARLRDG